MSTILFECDAGDGTDVRITPLRRNLRGALNLLNVKEPNAMLLAHEFKTPIPGQRVELNFKEGKATIHEPLHLPEHSATRKKIEKMGFSIPAEKEELKGFDGATWFYYVRRMQAEGTIRVLKGELPATQPAGEVKHAVVYRPTESRNDKRVDELASAVTSMAKTVNALMTITLAGMPAAQREKLMEQLAK